MKSFIVIFSASPAEVGPGVLGLGRGDDEADQDARGGLVGDHRHPGPGARVGDEGGVVKPGDLMEDVWI